MIGQYAAEKPARRRVLVVGDSPKHGELRLATTRERLLLNAKASDPVDRPKLEGVQRLRMRLMYVALKAGLELPLDVSTWPELAPLKKGKYGIDERAGVVKERARLAAMPEAERAAEMLSLAKMVGEACDG